MNEAQKNAIETNMVELCEAIESHLFLPFMRIRGLLKRNECELINNEITNEAKVLKTFDILKTKEGGWEATILFLDGTGVCPNTVGKLKSLGGYTESHSKANVQAELEQLRLSPESSDWRHFIRDVADFYLGDYRVVESFDVDGDSDLIESVWVDLQLKGSRELIGHYGEIFIQMRAKNCRLAIVRGQPGSGKTTLAKKIAYDWAKQQNNWLDRIRASSTFLPSSNRFDLILAVPLRDVPNSADLLQLAVGRFVANNSQATRQICADLRHQNMKILIILDGLDEYQIPFDSPLSSIFGSPVNKDVNITSTACSGKFDFDLLITSRPFACQLIHADITVIKYEIIGFTEEKQNEFLTKRCKKPEGKQKAQEYLNQSKCLKEIAQNPLLLTLICFLSDRKESIPPSLTKLYGTFVHRMLVRAAQKNAIGNKFDASNWQQSELVRNLGSLALLGVIKNQFQFNQEEIQMCHVTKEYFHSGLLQYCSDPVGLALKCDFPHRSIQDFLAAFYAVNYWGDKTLTEATGWPENVWAKAAVKGIPQMKSEWLMAGEIHSDQFCRFSFGLLSGRNDFSARCRLVVDAVVVRCPPLLLCPIRLIALGYDLADCSDQEQFAAGQISNNAVQTVIDRHHFIPSEVEMQKFTLVYGRLLMWENSVMGYNLSRQLHKLPPNFRKGLKYTEQGPSRSFSVGTDNHHHLKILCLEVGAKPVDAKDMRPELLDQSFWDKMGVDRSSSETTIDVFTNLIGDEIIRQNISKGLYNHIGLLHIYMSSSLQENFVAIQQILTHIPHVITLEMLELERSPLDRPAFVNFTIEPQRVASSKSFSLSYLSMKVCPTCNGETIRSANCFQSEKIKVSSVAETSDSERGIMWVWVTIAVDNNFSNVDILNAVWSVSLIGTPYHFEPRYSNC